MQKRLWYMHGRLCQVAQLLKMKMSRIVSLIETQIIQEIGNAWKLKEDFDDLINLLYGTWAHAGNDMLLLIGQGCGNPHEHPR